MRAWLSVVAVLVLASCGRPTGTAHDGAYIGHIVAPDGCARASYWRISFAIKNGSIFGTEQISGDEGMQFILGSVDADGTVHAYKGIGGHKWGWGTQAVDLEFDGSGNNFTMKGESRCAIHTVWIGTRTGPVPWWVGGYNSL